MLNVVRNGNTVTVLALDEREEQYLGLIYSSLSYSLAVRAAGGKTRWEQRWLSNRDKTEIVFAYGLWPRVYDLLNTNRIKFSMIDMTTNDPFLLKPDWSKVKPEELRTGQKACLESIIANRTGIVKATTGFGKTYLIAVLAKLFPNSKIHVCTKSVDIARHIYEDLKKRLRSVGMVGGGKKEESSRVTVYTADSLMKSPGDADFFIYDECHTAAAPTYQKVIRALYKNSRNYGFSATPFNRGDGADMVVEMLFGRIIYEMNYEEAADKGLVVPIKVRWLKCPPCYPKFMSCTVAALRNRGCIWENSKRNALIASDIHSHYDRDSSVLILVSTVAHAVNLHKLLPEFTLCYSTMKDEDKARYVAQGLLPSDYEPLSKKQRAQLYDDFLSGKVKQVIATDVWSTGVDFPALECVYNVSGRVSQILNTQSAGRVSRLFKGKNYGTVVEVYDGFSPEYESASKARHKLYSGLGWEQLNYPSGRSK